MTLRAPPCTATVRAVRDSEDACFDRERVDAYADSAHHLPQHRAYPASRSTFPANAWLIWWPRPGRNRQQSADRPRAITG